MHAHRFDPPRGRTARDHCACFALALVLLALAPATVDAAEPRHAVSIDLLLPVAAPVSKASGEMAWIPVNVKYQQVLSDHLALMAKAGIGYSWATGEKILEVYPMLGLEWRPFHKGLRGFYLGPALLVSYCHYWNDYAVVDNPDHLYRIEAGVHLGWQFRLRPHLSLDVTFGLGYGYDAEVDRDGVATTGFSVDELIGGIFLGWIF